MPPLSNVVYIDTLILLSSLSFAMDYLLLWATSKVAKVPRKPGRLACGAALGTSYFVLYYLSERGIVPYYGWLQFWPVLIAVSVLMLLFAYYPLPFPRLIRVTGYFYFITVSSGGAGVAAGYALGWGEVWRLIVSIAAILITAELGWGVVQKTIWQRLYQIPLEVVVFGDRVTTNALLDTGNQLRDPVRGSPVVVLEHGAVAHLLPDHLREVMERMEHGDLTEVSRLLTSSRWAARFRVIPFTSLGKENGMLVGFRPDEIAVTIEGRRIALDHVVVGIYHKPLDPEGAYRALIHPELLQSAMRVAEWDDQTLSTPGNKGESTHVTTPS